MSDLRRVKVSDYGRNWFGMLHGFFQRQDTPVALVENADGQVVIVELRYNCVNFLTAKEIDAIEGIDAAIEDCSACQHIRQNHGGFPPRLPGEPHAPGATRCLVKGCGCQEFQS